MAESPPDADDSRGQDYWQELVRGVVDASKEVDKLVTTLAGGALGLSLVFIRDLAPNPTATWTLVVSWASLSVALLATLTSLVASGVAYESILAELHAGTSVDEVNINPKSAKVTRFLARLSVGALTVGVGFLVSFAFVNLQPAP